MLVRVLLTYAVMTTCAFAMHGDTYAVFELREQLLRLTLNLWELWDQLRYASELLLQRVYQSIPLRDTEFYRWSKDSHINRNLLNAI